MLAICEETKVFVSACEAIHGLLVQGPLPYDDRDVIEISAIELLGKLRPD
jgi:hypothetical protein